MYCDNCGNKLRDGAKFCNKCGMQIESETISSDVIEKREDISNDQIPSTSYLHHFETKPKTNNEKSPANSPKNKKRIITVSAITAVFLVVMIIAVSVLSRSGNSKTISSSFSIPQAFTVHEKGAKASSCRLLSANANHVIDHSFYIDYQSSDNGLFAFASNEKGIEYIFVYDIDGNLVLQKQTCKNQFFLSGNGKTLAYYSLNNDGVTVVDVANDKETAIKLYGKYSLEGISYNGETVVINDGLRCVCYQNGRKDSSLEAWSHLLGISDNNSYFYYYSSYHEKSSDINGNTTSEEDKKELCVWHDSTIRKIADINPEQSACLIAISEKGDEALFWHDSNLYYYNYTNDQTKTISGIKKPIASFETARGENGYGFICNKRNRYSQRQILNSFYLDSENSENVSVGYLNDQFEYRVLATIDNKYHTSWLSVSDDRSKLWCINNGKVYYYEIDGKNLITKSSDIPVMMNQRSNKNYPVLSASSDGEKACFISSDGIAYLVTPETIRKPVKVLDGAKVPVFSSDDQLYIRKGTVSGSIYAPGDLYQITDDNQASFQYANVVIALPIKSGLFLFTEYSDEKNTYTVLKNENGNYRIVTNDAGGSLTFLW